MSVVIHIFAWLLIAVYLLPFWLKQIKKYMVSRYFQGRIKDVTTWSKAIERKCLKWLNCTPTLSKRDDEYFTLFDVILSKNKVKSIQVWQEAGLYLGLKEFSYDTNEKVREKIDFFEQNFLSKIDSIHDADFGLLAYALLNESPNSISDAMLGYIKSNIMACNVIKYKSGINNSAFIDTIGFVCPFLIKSSYVYNDYSYFELAMEQFRFYFEFGIEKNSLLPFHAIDTETKTTLGICDWARGTAWLLIGLMGSYKTIRDYGDSNEVIYNYINKYADIILKYQKDSGGFAWRLLTTYDTDTSATAVFGWYLACCTTYIGDKKYYLAAEKCRSYLMQVTNNNGVIDNCQGDTIGVGIYSRKFDRMPFAQGFALRMQGEIENAKKNLSWT